MSRKRKGSFVVFALIAGMVVAAAAQVLPGRGQSPVPGDAPPPIKSSSIKLAAATAPGAATAAAPAVGADGPVPSVSPGAAFAAAASHNLALRDGLWWTFGGKQQRGWHLYVPLIQQTLAVEAEPGTGEFAYALSRWQQSAGLPPSGVLDGDTWFKMFSEWQARRLKDRTYPRADQLVTAAPEEFWDPARPAELRQVERETYEAYRRMVAAAIADPTLKLATTPDGPRLAPAEKYLKIVSAFRSKAYQDQLRRQSPNSGRAGLAVNSPHFTGRALDLYVGGEPVETKDSNRALQVQTPVYKWLVKNAGRFGFRPYYYEPWHWEYRPH